MKFNEQPTLIGEGYRPLAYMIMWDMLKILIYMDTDQLFLLSSSLEDTCHHKNSVYQVIKSTSILSLLHKLTSCIINSNHVTKSQT